MYKVKDYKFESEKDAKEAQSELRAVDYLRTKVDMEQPQAALEIYKQLIEQNIFHTIVGYDFLKGLQNFLRTSSAIDNRDIPQIPDELAQSILPKIDAVPKPEAASAGTKGAAAAGKTAGTKGAGKAAEPVPLSSLTPVPKLNEEAHREAEEEEKAKKAAAGRRSRRDKASEKKAREKKPSEKKERRPLFSFLKKDKPSADGKKDATTADGKKDGTSGDRKKDKASEARQKNRTKKAAAEAVDGRYKRYAFLFGGTTVVLAVTVIVMILISMTGDNPTILDYENKLINRYSDWETELTNKEKELKSRENDVEFRENALQNQTFAPKKQTTETPAATEGTTETPAVTTTPAATEGTTETPAATGGTTDTPAVTTTPAATEGTTGTPAATGGTTDTPAELPAGMEGTM